jgi:hypothetical protein
MMPPLRNLGRALSCVGYADLAKPCSFNESFVLSRRTVHVEADRTARRNFLVGQHSADHQSVTEQHPPARFQYAKHLTQQLGAAWNMAQNVIREHGVKRLIVESEILRNVRLLETRPRSETSREPRCVNVEPDEAATHSFRKV